MVVNHGKFNLSIKSSCNNLGGKGTRLEVTQISQIL